MSDTTLQKFEWVELDMPRCSLTFGLPPCTATLAIGGGQECFNTRATCLAPTSYNQGTMTLRFCKSAAFLPQDGRYYIPSLDGVSIGAGSINPVGASSNSTALGTRGSLSVSLSDHAHTDKIVDPYVDARRARIPTYDPTQLGTFWTKWRARNPYYLNRVIRYCVGTISGGSLIDVVTRTYFTSSFDGPSSDGKVSIQARDVLSQFANGKAKAPFASTGKLLADVDAVTTTITLNPVGVGDLEYPASGVIRKGKELCDFTRSGDVMTIVRGRYRTDAADAKAGDVIQLCLVYSAATPAAILEDLTKNYAAIPVQYLNLTQWSAEQTDYMPRLYSTIITEPTGIEELVAEMCQQMYFYPIWDERNAKLNIRAIRPSENDTVHQLSDFRNLVADSITIRDLQGQLVTQVWVYYGLLNPTEKSNEAKNYAVREIVSSDEGSDQKNGKESIKEIFCRWIPSTNGAAAVDLGTKMLARYRSVPRQASFKLTSKNSDIWLGDFVSVDHRNCVDIFGNSQPMNIQILSAQESKPGIEFSYIGQQFIFEEPANPDERLIIIAADQLNVNLRTLHDSVYTAPVGGEVIRVVVRSGVVIGARGYEFSETFSGSLKGYYYNTTPTTITRDFAPLMRREATGTTNFAVGATITNGAISYELMSDMREVPPSIAFDTGTWPGGVTIEMTVLSGAYIVGEGGFSSVNAGRNVSNIFTRLAIASDGGNAMRIQHPITINNSGIIAGGGGGGFPSIMPQSDTGSLLFAVQPSGTGAGRLAHDALAVADFDPLMPSYLAGKYAIVMTPSGGSLTAGGYGTAQSLAVGVYGTFYGGAAGAIGSDSDPSFVVADGLGVTTPAPAYIGGRTGYSISEGASLITWTNKGDVRGPEIA